MNQNNKFSIKERIRSFKYALEGIVYFTKTVHNGWIHYLATFITVSLGIFFKLNIVEWLWIIQAIFLVFIAEMVNSAIEKNVDLVTEEQNERAKRAKDMAAGAVLLAAFYAIIVGVIVFLPYLNQLL
ncbi:MAG: diacylglycerol kinase family protein [Crocinitomicaceae bacterium]|nr:diacylglycerol kinase family protein [Crocinitomicaceae bacterium]